jgi:hypothetical protein
MQQNDRTTHIRLAGRQMQAGTVTAKGKKGTRIKDIARIDITPITFSRIINFAQFGRLLARDGACRKWIDRKMVALPADFRAAARPDAGDIFRSGLRGVLIYPV